MWIAHDIHAWGNRQQADIVVRASANAIEAKRAVEVAGLTWQIKIRLAASMKRISAQTIVGFAVGANRRLPDFNFEGRNQRRHKLELSDWTNVFAKARATKERVDGKGDKEIVEDQPGRPDRLVPKAEDLIRPKKQYPQREREPF